MYFCHSVTEMWKNFQAVTLCPEIRTLQEIMQYPQRVTFMLGSSPQNCEEVFWLKY